jgi:hypothetical protein
VSLLLGLDKFCKAFYLTRAIYQRTVSTCIEKKRKEIE